jgi:hypothetical protein
MSSGTGPTYVNYSSLVQDIQRYLERGQSSIGDPTVFDQIPRLINAAERKLAQVLKLQGMIEVLVDNTGLVAGNPIIAKPDRWRETVSMYYGAGSGNNTRTLLLPRSLDYIRNYWPQDNVTDPEQPPLYYGDYDLTHWIIAPTPPVTYPLEVLCYMMPALLCESNQSNFWSIYAPNALLYGALLEASPFLKDDTRIATWQGYYQFELSTLTTQDTDKILDRAAERKRP